jgi:hypothetical protein
MTHLTKLLCSLIYASAFLWLGIYTSHSVSLTRISEARANADRAKYESQIAQFTAINTYWALEAQRTETEKAVKRAVFAEWRLQTVCKRAKGRC